MATVYAAIFRAEGGLGASAVAPKLLADWADPSRSPRSTDVAAILAQTSTQFPTQVSHSTAQYLYHVLVGPPSQTSRSFVYVAVAQPSFDKATAFAFLESLKASLNGRPDWVAIADRLGAAGTPRGAEKPLQSEMESTIAKAVATLNGSEPDKMGALAAQVAAVKAVMTTNVERVLERGERLDDLMGRSEDLESASASFRTNAHQVQRAMCWKNMKCNLIIIAAIVILIIVIGLVVGFETGAFKTGGSSAVTTTVAPTTTK